MSIYKDLEMIIADYVGYTEDGVYEQGGYSCTNYECADPVLYDALIHECSLHIDGAPLEMLSDDAKYCIEDVIMPLPGNAIRLPTNDTADIYHQLLAADGISLSFFKDKAPVQYRMKGTYRRIIQNVHDLSWKMKGSV